MRRSLGMKRTLGAIRRKHSRSSRRGSRGCLRQRLTDRQVRILVVLVCRREGKWLQSDGGWRGRRLEDVVARRPGGLIQGASSLEEDAISRSHHSRTISPSARLPLDVLVVRMKVLGVLEIDHRLACGFLRLLQHLVPVPVQRWDDDRPGYEPRVPGRQQLEVSPLPSVVVQPGFSPVGDQRPLVGDPGVHASEALVVHVADVPHLPDRLGPPSLHHRDEPRGRLYPLHQGQESRHRPHLLVPDPELAPHPGLGRVAPGPHQLVLEDRVRVGDRVPHVPFPLRVGGSQLCPHAAEACDGAILGEVLVGSEEPAGEEGRDFEVVLEEDGDLVRVMRGRLPGLDPVCRDTHMLRPLVQLFDPPRPVQTLHHVGSLRVRRKVRRTVLVHVQVRAYPVVVSGAKGLEEPRERVRPIARQDDEAEAVIPVGPLHLWQDDHRPTAAVNT
eukprot:765459-Hanusia_phi.AAC.4